MRNSRIQLLAAGAIIMALPLAGGTVALASGTAHSQVRAHVTATPRTVQGTGFGTGTTSTMAGAAALRDLRANFFGCTDVALLYDTGSGSHWSAEYTGVCQGYELAAAGR